MSLEPSSASSECATLLDLSGSEGSDQDSGKLEKYLNALDLNKTAPGAQQSTLEEIKTTPLFSWLTKQRAENPDPNASTSIPKVSFTQYALLGEELQSAARQTPTDQTRPIFLNTDAPWSAFLCGSQGSGKSYTLSCILEGCLLPNATIGQLSKPLAGIVFHYDPHGSRQACEAAFLSSHIPVTVLVSPSNFWERQSVYGQVRGREIRVRPMLLQDMHLNVQRMRRLMAFSDSDGSIPLYMEVIVRILRNMAIEAKGAGRGLAYSEFLRRLGREDSEFSKMQKGPMNLRLQLLDAFMAISYAPKRSFGLSRDAMAENLFATKPGTLTIVDLTDPFIDPASACSLFDMCLALFLEHDTKAGRVVALDEAHKFMTATDASNDFTSSLLQLIREQRHKGARVVVSTQEPSISPRLLDLCSMTFVHRFTSPAWLASLQTHLAGADTADGKRALMDEIVNLGVGESLLFAPSAMLDVVDGTPAVAAGLAASRSDTANADGEVKLSAAERITRVRAARLAEEARVKGAAHEMPRPSAIAKLGMQHIKFRTRPRLTADGGRSILASTGVAR